MIHCSFFYLVISVLAFSVDREGHVAGTQLPRVRGIPISKISLYHPEQDFECLDGSRLIAFERINDDYCDCGDGSDEPGTAACPNGVFFCQNTGHRDKYLPSSRVNDGICDCCDASDEYASGKQCLDNCKELGREARLEAEKAADLAKEGNKIRLDMLALGKKVKSENQMKLVKLRSDYEEADLTKKEKEVLKNQAEERENSALEKYKPAESEHVPNDGKKEEEGEVSEAEDYFKMLDSDKSGTISIVELQTRVTFDKDGNGEVTEEEALFFLNNKKELTYEEFIDIAWANIKPFLMREQGSFRPPSRTEKKDTPEDHEESPDHPVEEDAETEGEEEHHEEEYEKEPEEPEIHYDEETQALIDEATQARERYQEAEKSVQELQSEIRRLEEKIERDYGPEEEFSSLDGECFEHRDLEYVYTLCLFGKASQRSVSGGVEVNLGHWHEWVGPETNKYSKMKYDRGLTCWNGPARNTLVNLRCGKENRLLSVSEPNRCEYTMEFMTPALCNPDIDTSDTHDELPPVPSASRTYNRPCVPSRLPMDVFYVLSTPSSWIGKKTA